MARSGDAGGGDGDVSRFGRGTSRLPETIMGVLIVMGVLAVILAGGGKKKKPTPPIDAGIRAVVVPTADRPRTVVVPPCGTGERITSRNGAAQAQTPGATVLRLPRAERTRVLLVPRCSASTATAGATSVSKVPSSAFVLTAGARTEPATSASAGDAKIASRAQVIVPSSSTGRMIVVPPCTGTGRAGQATVLKPQAANPTTLIAPSC